MKIRFSIQNLISLIILTLFIVVAFFHNVFFAHASVLIECQTFCPAGTCVRQFPADPTSYQCVIPQTGGSSGTTDPNAGMYNLGVENQNSGTVDPNQGMYNLGVENQTNSTNQTTNTSGNNPGQTGVTQNNTGQSNVSQNNTGSQSLTNPLKSTSFTGPDGLFTKIIDVILIFALPIIIFFIMYAGFMYVTAAGDTSKISTAHSALTWAVIGGVIVLGSKLIMEVIQNTVRSF